MKNIIFLLITISFLTSCKSTMLYNFTTVKEIYELKKGMSMSEVNSSLNVLPYEFYTNFEDGNKVLAYKYRRIYQKVKMGSEVNMLNVEAIRYKDDEDVYVVFEQKNNSMLYYITGNGRKSAKGIITNSNKLSLIKSSPLSFDNTSELPTSTIAPSKKPNSIFLKKLLKLDNR